MSKGDEKLWAILNEKLDTLRGMGQLPEAIRVAETAAELARRAFAPSDPAVSLSLEKLGQLRDAGILSGEEFEAKKAALLSRL